MDCSPPGSSVHRIFQARTLEQVAISFSRGSSPPRNQTCVSCISLHPQADFFIAGATQNHDTKAFDKIQYPLMIETFSKFVTEEKFYSLIKNCYENPTVNFKLNCERLPAFHLRSGTRQKVSTLTTLTQHGTGNASQSTNVRKK